MFGLPDSSDMTLNNCRENSHQKFAVNLRGILRLIPLSVQEANARQHLHIRTDHRQERARLEFNKESDYGDYVTYED